MFLVLNLILIVTILEIIIQFITLSFDWSIYPIDIYNEMEDRAEDKKATQRMQNVTQRDKDTENTEFRKLGNEVQTEQMYLDPSDFQKTILR